MKNHKKVNGKLLQTNKKFSHLKQAQKEFIMQELYLQCKEYTIENGTFPYKAGLFTVLDKVYQCIEQREIWIPYEEVYQHFQSKITKFQNRLMKEGMLFYKDGKLKLFRKVIVFMTMSLDGSIIDPDGKDPETEKERYKEIADTFLNNAEDEKIQEGTQRFATRKDWIDTLRKENGKHIVVSGSAEFVTSFLLEDVADEYILTIKPILLHGQREDLKWNNRLNLKLLSVKKEGENAVLHYQRIR